MELRFGYWYRDMTTQQKLPSLAICLILDLIGMASMIIPGLGEGFDLVWAPLAGFIFYRLFPGLTGKIGGVFSFLEEISPYTDFIPTFTIAWLFHRFASKTKKLDELTDSDS